MKQVNLKAKVGKYLKKLENAIKVLAEKYAKELKSKVNERVAEMQDDDKSHYLLYRVLGITEKEGDLIDIYQNKGRFLYKYAGSFLEEAAILCFEYKYKHALRKQKVENTHEIEHLYVQVYSEVQKDNMDIRVPVDFDDSKFNINDNVRLTGKDVARLQTGTKRVDVTTANGRTRQETVADYFFPVSAEGLEKVTNQSATPAPPTPQPKEENQKK